MRSDQVMISVSGDGQDGLPVKLRVVESVKQVNAAGTGGCNAYAQPSGEFRIAARGERSGFLVANLNEPQLLLIFAQRLEDAIDSVAGEPKDGVHSPID